MSESERRYVGIPHAAVYVHCAGPDGSSRVEPLRHIVYHSPSGLNWGYGGSGPADLALSILADHLGERRLMPRQHAFEARALRAIERTRAFRLHQQLKWDLIAGLPQDEAWQITGAEIDGWLMGLVDRQQTPELDSEARIAARLCVLKGARR
jgi:hypothetical protein